MKKALLASLMLAGALGGCGSRNLYKNTRIENPPLERTFVHMTRTQNPEAGVEPTEFGSPAATSDTVFVSSETNGIEAFERSTFRRRWHLPIKNGVVSEPIIENGILYFGGNDGNFYAVDAEFGRVLWKYETKAPVYGRPALIGQRVYFLASDDVVHCLDQSNGKWVWHYKRGGNYITTVRGNSSPVVSDGFAYVGFSDGYLVALDAKDGNLRWEQRIHKGTKFTDVDAMVQLDGDRLYIPSYDGELYALNRQSGKVLWHIDVGGSKKVLIDGGTLYLGASSGNIMSINKDTGRIGWKFELDQGTPTNLVQHENYIAFGSSQQYFYAIHKGDGTLAYRFNAGLRSGFFSSPVQSGNEIYALSNFGNMYVFRWNLASRGTRVN